MALRTATIKTHKTKSWATSHNSSKRRSLWPVCAVCAAMLWGCAGNVVYDGHSEIDDNGWEAYDRQTFMIDVPRAGMYDIDMFLMHDNDYRYRNVWLFIDYIHDGNIVVTDTVNCLLADTYGRWYGGGWGSYFQYEQRLKEGIGLDSGRYEVRVAQGMRERNLKGIETVGVRVTPHVEQAESH